MSADLREKLKAAEEELTALAHHCRKFARGRNEPDDEDPRDLFGAVADVLDRYRAEITDREPDGWTTPTKLEGLSHELGRYTSGTIKVYRDPPPKNALPVYIGPPIQPQEEEDAP